MTTRKLVRGETAPDFQTVDLPGQRFQLSHLNSRGVWLALYRYASCPMCNLHFDDVLSQKSLLIDSGVQFVAVFESERENFPTKILSKQTPNVTMVANPGREIYSLYGAEQSWLGWISPQPVIERVKAGLNGYVEGKIDGPLDRIPAHFLILPNGQIHTAYYGKNIADNLKWRDLQPYFTALKNKEVIARPPKANAQSVVDEITFINDGVGNRRPQPPPIPPKKSETVDDDKTDKITRT